ncbi:MAG: hypothetical protein HYX92_17600 [Chloroflexi bacterium]|nr:hypothetical protein [Chloroflexota bacterium]
MVARRIGYVLGFLLALRGLMLLIQPRLLFRVWESRLRFFYPGPADRLMHDFFCQSDAMIRLLGFWLTAWGGLMMWLARKARE